MKQVFDVNSWNRKEHYEFFKNFDQPYFGFTVNVSCKKAYEHCNEHNISFFLFYLHKILYAINGVENLKLRIAGEEVILYDVINVSPTIGREDHTFGFSYIPFDNDFQVFEKHGKAAIEDVRIKSGLCLSENASRLDVVHFSSLPWFSFTSVSHARNSSIIDSVPKISIGKAKIDKDMSSMPVSLHAHHALADGHDAAMFFQKFESLMNLE